MTRYSTRTDAVQAEIIDPIEASGIVENAWESFDIHAIEDRVLADALNGYAIKVDAEEFWAIVEENAI